MRKFSFFDKLLRRSQEDDDGEIEHLDLLEKERIRGIVKLSDTSVREVMVPRIDVVFLSLDAPRAELLQAVTESGHSRLPVYTDTIDNVVGILYAKDLLKYFVINDEPLEMGKIVRKPYFVPESKKLDSLLTEFQRRKVHLAVVVDEYGGTSGIVSLEDILEEIVGDIQDEFDNELEEIVEIGDNVFLCDARVSINELNERLSISLPEENYDKLGGFVFHLFGKIPVKFEKVSYENSSVNINFIIQQMEQHKITTVKIVVTKHEGD